MYIYSSPLQAANTTNPPVFSLNKRTSEETLPIRNRPSTSSAVLNISWSLTTVWRSFWTVFTPKVLKHPEHYLTLEETPGSPCSLASVVFHSTHMTVWKFWQRDSTRGERSRLRSECSRFSNANILASLFTRTENSALLLLSSCQVSTFPTDKVYLSRQHGRSSDMNVFLPFVLFNNLIQNVFLLLACLRSSPLKVFFWLSFVSVV